MIEESVKDNIWFKRYGNYLNYQKLLEELSTVENESKKFKTGKDKAALDRYEKLLSKQESLKQQIELLQEYKTSPFSTLVEPVELESYPKVTNPFAIISALSYIKKIKQDSTEYKTRIDQLTVLVTKLKEKMHLLEEIYRIENSVINEDLIYEAQKELNAFTTAQEIANTSYSLHVKKSGRGQCAHYTRYYRANETCV
ncbi:MAG: hypothetical protein LRY68_09400 [Sulfurospirillum sp.]|nr:hypothetical protein [Sulfurospirillum sp.]